jgi:AcrR family transcriptional regulator
MPLSREQILIAAVALADREGLEVVSMRRLGRELGVQAMSLYNHVPNKDAILDGMVERVLGEIELPQAGGDWEASLRRCALSTHDTLVRHPWACALVMVPGVGPRALLARLGYIEALLQTLREAGFTPSEASYAYHAIDSHTLGFTMWQLGHTAPAETVADEALRAIGSGEYPYLVEHAKEHETESDPTAFEFGLDLIFDGLRRMRSS